MKKKIKDYLDKFNHKPFEFYFCDSCPLGMINLNDFYGQNLKHESCGKRFNNLLKENLIFDKNLPNCDIIDFGDNNVCYKRIEYLKCHQKYILEIE